MCDMLITTTHLRILNEVATREDAGRIGQAWPEDEAQEHIYRELEVQDFLALEPPRAYRLTYAGREALNITRTMHEAGLFPPLEQLEIDWRFLGSDTLAA